MPEKFALFTAIASSQPPDFRPGLPVTNDWLSLDSHNHLLRNLGLKTWHTMSGNYSWATSAAASNPQVLSPENPGIGRSIILEF